MAVNRLPIACVAAFPTEHTNEEVLDGLYLKGAKKVFPTVFVTGVDALSVHHLQLVVDEMVTIFLAGKEVSLNLDSLVATAYNGAFATVVTHACQFLDHLRVVTAAKVPWAIGVLERESSLELSNFNAEGIPARPFHIDVLQVRGGVVHLKLDAILEVVQYGAVEVKAQVSLAEAVASSLAGLVGIGVFANKVTADFRCADIVGQSPS